MADNTQLNQNTTPGDIIATEDIGGVKHELVIVEFSDGAGGATKVSAATPLPVAATISTAGLATSANQATEITSLQSIDAKLTNPLPVSISQDIEIGKAKLLDAAGTNLASISASGALKVDGSAVVQPVSATALPLPTGASTAANQATEIASLASIDSKLSNPLPVTPSLPANAAIETGGNLAAILAKLSNDPATQTTLAAILAKLIAAPATAANQSTEIASLASIDGKLTSPISVTPSLPANAAQETGGNLAAILAKIIAAPATAANQVTEITALQSIDAGTAAALGQTTMANSVPVTLASDQTAIPVTVSGASTDNTQLLSSTISSAGATSGINTTGYLSTVTQFTGTWVGALVFEGSNDNSNWVELLALNTDDLSMQDAIYGNGVFVVKTSAKFIRINVLQLQSGSIVTLMFGRISVGISASDLLSVALENNSGVSLNVSETKTKKDITNAFIPSDAPAAIYGSSNINNGVVALIDTTGYQSASIQLFGTYVANAGCFYSNDGVNFSAAANLYGTVGGSGSASVISMNTNTVYIIPVYAKFLKIQITSYVSGVLQALIYLRQQPFIGAMSLNENLVLLNGVAPITAAAGVLAVGGNVAAGAAPTANPNLVAGIDTSGLTRRILTDTSGRIIQAVTDSAGTVRPLTSLPPTTNSQNVTSLPVSDITNFEGQTQIEILAQILLELRINNQMMSDLPLMLSGQNLKFDDPQQYRNDASLFAV